MSCLLASAALLVMTLDGGTSVTAPPIVTRGPYLQLGTPTNIVVRWRTDIPTPSRVRFGFRADALEWQVTDATPAINHAVTLTNLAPATRYFYAVGTDSADLAKSTNHYFYAAPLGAKPTRIWVIGDAGTSFNQPDYTGLGLIAEGQRAVRDAYYRHAQGRYADVWLLLGDNAYNDGNDGDYTTNFFNIYPEVTRQSVIWPAIGNHEVNLSTGDAPAYLDIFTLPTGGEAGGIPSGDEHYYSFDYGNIHFVCLDSEISSRETASAQLIWLEADLAANTNDWLIVFWHSPPYSKGSHDSDVRSGLIKMRQNVVPLIERYGVDLVLCGHSHVYERSYLIDGHYGSSFTWEPDMAKDAGSGRTNETGPYLKAAFGPNPRQGAVYVVAGSSGWTWNHYGLNHPAMFTGMSQLGSMTIDVDGQRLDARFIRETGAIDDYFTIIKGEPPAVLQFATFRIVDGQIQAAWKSVPDQIYRVEHKGQLNDGEWVAVSDVIRATGATTRWSGPAEPGAEQSYYRVSKLP